MKTTLLTASTLSLLLLAGSLWARSQTDAALFSRQTIDARVQTSGSCPYLESLRSGTTCPNATKSEFVQPACPYLNETSRAGCPFSGEGPRTVRADAGQRSV